MTITAHIQTSSKDTLLSVGAVSRLTISKSVRFLDLHEAFKFRKRLATLIAVKSGHVKNSNTGFNMTAPHCMTETDRLQTVLALCT